MRGWRKELVRIFLSFSAEAVSKQDSVISLVSQDERECCFTFVSGNKMFLADSVRNIICMVFALTTDAALETLAEVKSRNRQICFNFILEQCIYNNGFF